MRYVDEFRDPAGARDLLRAAADLAAEVVPRYGPVRLMEICGGHTHTIYRHGIEQLLPEGVGLVHGPGCPVCVIPMGRLDDALWLAAQPGVTLTCFGDLMRVPGTTGSLLDARARGADVRFVYSPLDALRLAGELPDRQVVFVALGFETTAPSTAATLLRARETGVENFSVFSNHVLIEPPLRAILDDPGGEGAPELAGFIGPGHVATVTGLAPFRFIPREYDRPVVVAGFEPLDVLSAVVKLLAQLRDGRREVENQYARVVRPEGNPAALALLDTVFAVRDSFEWRGLGHLPRSGLGLSPAFADLDAERRFAVPGARVADPPTCQCGEVLRGVLEPWRCGVFGTACTPETPIGTCMVSPEGACAAYYTFGRRTLGLVPS